MKNDKSLQERQHENIIKERDIWLQFALSFSINNKNGIKYFKDGIGNVSIQNDIACRADEMLKQYKERFYE